MSVSEKEYYQLTISISKALSGMEMPLKHKHARAAIIGTFHTQGAHSFWANVLRQPLQENRITAWKFCHLLHKVLREGHPLCCQHSMRHRGMLAELGKLWGHLNDGYGLCIRHYTKLLIMKLEFHDRNPRIPGNLALKRGELEAMAGNDINFYFEMAVEMFDYLDDIIALQATIFNSITTFHVNSMTSAGQCRLSPLIPLIQDSNQLYDFLVRIMFKLHANLPNDVLVGHRDRFRSIFIQLKSFYTQSRNLQYFVNLITVPKLPENAPNFSSQVEFGSYTAPVVVIPEPEPDPIVDDLVDMAMPPVREPERPQQKKIVSQQQVEASPPPPPRIDYERIIHDRDNMIQALQMDAYRLEKHIKVLTLEQREQQGRFEERVAVLNSQISDAHEELTNMRFVKEELELKASSAEKAQVEEERIKQSEEKFQKLKIMYQQIRDEHVKLLRQHGEVSKQLAQSTKIAGDAVTEKEAAKSQLDELQQAQRVIDENRQCSTENTERERIELADRCQQLENENSVLSAQYEDVKAMATGDKAEFEATKDELKRKISELQQNENVLQRRCTDLDTEVKTVHLSKNEIEDKCHALTVELQTFQTKLMDHSKETESVLKLASDSKDMNKDLLQKIEQLSGTNEMLMKQCEDNNRLKEINAGEMSDLCKAIEELKAGNAQLGKEKEIMQQEVDQIRNEFNERVKEYENSAEELRATIESKTGEIESLTTVVGETEQKYKQLYENAARLQNDRDRFESDSLDLLHEQEELAERYASSCSTIKALESTLQDAKIREDARLRALVEACIKSSGKLASRAMTENDVVAGATGTSAYFMMIAEELQTVLNELAIVYEQYLADNTNVEGFARKVVLGGHLMATVHVQGMLICNTSTDIDCGERISEKIKKWNTNVLNLFAALENSNESASAKLRIVDVKTELQAISTMIHDLSKKLTDNEMVGDIIESELAGMDKAIEEAAAKIEEMISKSKASDSGIKLEVNEKILDACTTLMNNIRLLVKKSRLLQAEIVSAGKGTASAKEFYKRNHQWTEGLISAAKNIAQGANFLVSAANKAVTGDSQHQLDLIVAAQEIAACTAQLVVSSRVKASRGSSNLNALGQASRDVTQATGAVVATVKDCSKRLEDSQDMDLTNLSVHQAKTLEMEIQVKVLELEQGLQVARSKLAAFRRKNYREN